MAAPDGGQRYFREKTYGLGRPHLSFNDIKAMPVPLPPLDEQAALVAAADDHLADIAQGKKHLLEALDGVERFRMACLAAAFEGSWTDGDFVETALDEVAIVQSGLAKGRAKGDEVAELPYIRTANVQAMHLDLEVIKTIPVTDAQRLKHRLQRDDVLVLEGGDADKVGRGWLWQSELEECLHQNHVFAVRADRQRLHPKYLAYFINAPQGRRYFLGCAKQTVNLASINKTQLRALPLPLAPVETQATLVERLDRQLAAAATYETSLGEQLVSADALERSVLAEAVQGRLTSDFGGDPAPSLAAALREKRAEAAALAKTSRKNGRAVPVGR
jgi:type I restriction enzyme S subunit